MKSNLIFETKAFLSNAILFLIICTLSTAQSQPKVEESIIEAEINSEEVNFKIVRIAEGFEHPWALGWLPDGRMLVTERPARLQLIDGNSVTEIKNLPPIHHAEDQLTAPQGGSQAGLLDLVVHPDYEENGWIYFTYSSPGDADGVDNGPATGTALARARLNDDETALVDLETLYTMIPRTEPGRHYGSRILFPGDGTLIFSIGDRGLRHPSQDLSHPAGSMIRLKEDGGVAEDNPFIAKAPGNLRPKNIQLRPQKQSGYRSGSCQW
jgi:aldose sugar dehydrogenase